MRTKTRIQAFGALVLMWLAAACTLIALVKCDPPPKVERFESNAGVVYVRDGALCYAGIRVYQSNLPISGVVRVPCDSIPPINVSR